MGARDGFEETAQHGLYGDSKPKKVTSTELKSLSLCLGHVLASRSLVDSPCCRSQCLSRIICPCADVIRKAMCETRTFFVLDVLRCPFLSAALRLETFVSGFSTREADGRPTPLPLSTASHIFPVNQIMQEAIKYHAGLGQNITSNMK
jgi:hypothetical protein